MQVFWSEVAPAARFMFSIWADQPEMRWAERSWGDLEQAGLTQFDDHIGRTRVELRLLSLAAFYHSFCNVCWEEGGIQLDVWCQDASLNPFRLAQLAGSGFMNTDDVSAEELVDEATLELVRAEFPGVAAVLRSAWGGESGLFASLWLSRDPELSGCRPIPREVLDEVLNDDLDEKGVGYDWVRAPHLLFA